MSTKFKIELDARLLERLLVFINRVVDGDVGVISEDGSEFFIDDDVDLTLAVGTLNQDLHRFAEDNPEFDQD